MDGWKQKRNNYMSKLQERSEAKIQQLKESIPKNEPQEISTTSVVKEETLPEPIKKIIETDEIDIQVQQENKAEIRKVKVEKTQVQLIEEKKQKEKNQKKLHEIKMSAITNRERGKAEDYEKKLIEWLALDPENHEFQERLSDLYFDQGNYVKAQSILKKIVNRDPSNHKAIWQIWQVYFKQDDLDTAKILIEKAISVKSDNPKYYISLVDILYTKGNIKEALKAMEQVLRLRPTKIDYLLWIASLHEENSEPNKARSYYSKIIELDPMQENAKVALQRMNS